MKTYNSLTTQEQINIDVAYERAILGIEKDIAILEERVVDTRDQDNSKEAAGVIEAMAVFYTAHMK